MGQIQKFFFFFSLIYSKKLTKPTRMLFSATLLAALFERGTAFALPAQSVQTYYSPWSAWSSYGRCNRGVKVRTCTCVSTPSACDNGKYLNERVSCAVPAPTMRIWSSWSSWGECVNQKRTRFANCLVPYSQYCQGTLEESMDCDPVVVVTTPPPTVPAQIWSSWGAWGSCNEGKRIRSCSCIHPNPAVCQGNLIEEQTCAEPTVAPTVVIPTAIWSSWSSWGSCSNGQRVRTCKCINSSPAICKGTLEERQMCSSPAVPTANCSGILRMSLNACLNIRALCYSWWNVAHLRNAQQCFGVWNYTPYMTARFNNIFGSFLSQY